MLLNFFVGFSFIFMGFYLIYHIYRAYRNYIENKQKSIEFRKKHNNHLERFKQAEEKFYKDQKANKSKITNNFFNKNKILTNVLHCKSKSQN